MLTEYTSFLAREGTNLADWNKLVLSSCRSIDGKAVANRSGQWAVTQSLNFESQKKQSRLNRRNGYLDAKLRNVEITGVEQVNKPLPLPPRLAMDRRPAHLRQGANSRPTRSSNTALLHTRSFWTRSSSRGVRARSRARATS